VLLQIDPARAHVGRRNFLACVGLGAVAIAITAHEIEEAMSIENPTLLERAIFGAFAANEPWPDLSAHYALEKELASPLKIMSWFLALDGGWPATQAAQAATSGHDLLVCLQPSTSSRIPVKYADILAGLWARRLDRFFLAAASYPGKVTIRFAHEMNLQQMPQSIVNANPCTTSLNEWLDTWRYMVERQRAVGGANISWQWCVSGIDMGGVPAESYWPGADYVDCLGMDAYNGFGPYTTPYKLLAPMYKRLTSLHPTAPVWLSEVGCREARIGETWDKAGWLHDLLQLYQFPRMEAVIFFNSNKEHDWRLTTDVVRDEMTGLMARAGSIVR
jgi:hypothetical protein